MRFMQDDPVALFLTGLIATLVGIACGLLVFELLR